MVNKKEAAAIVAVGTGVVTIAYTLASREAFELMGIAANKFIKDFFEKRANSSLLAEPSFDALFQAQEPYRTLFLVYSASAIAYGVTSIGSFIYATKDCIVKGLKPLYNLEKKIIDGLLNKRKLTPEDFIYWK